MRQEDTGYDVHAWQANTARVSRRAAKFHPPQTTVKQIKFCIKAELFQNSSAFENTER
ncbi:hypothetical protein [uncultured Campylobacter sp.]|uniref:hypothetical protein n=1 Tax=uncultured Campylobacter sp. TaxID=218934 RepID=UPI002605CC24|nr:hypothetical protein [uncultured Campylobacter sp.]